jgi:hypothetical protein
MLGSSWVAAQLAASQEGLGSVSAINIGLVTEDWTEPTDRWLRTEPCCTGYSILPPNTLFYYSIICITNTAALTDASKQAGMSETLWHVDTFAGQRLWVNSPLLSKAYKNKRQRIRRQQLDTFNFYATRCKDNNIGSGVFYEVRIYPLLGNEYVFNVSTSRLYK